MKKVQDDTVKISDKELQELQQNHMALGKIVNKIGEIEAHKHYVLKAHEEGEMKMREIRAALKEKYGTVNIDINTGEILPMEQEGNEKSQKNSK